MSSLPWIGLGSALALAWTGCTDADRPATADRAPREEARSAAIDVTALEPFWQIVDTLSADREPSPELWEALLSTPGYLALTESEFVPSYFVESFRLVYMPSLVDSLAVALEDASGSRRLRHYLQVAERRTELTAFSEELTSSDRAREPARLAAEWLPGAEPEHPAPIALVVFDLDARGYDPIAVDLLAAKELDLLPFLAHESHHWYRNDRAAVDWDDVPPPDADLLWTLYQVQGEGLADQIDKRPWLEGKAPVPTARESYARDYLEALARTPGILRELDSLLLERGTTTDPERMAAIGARAAEIVPMSGHPTGYFMARTILDTLGHDRLVQDVANPVAFFRAYDEAARASGQPGLSEGALLGLDRLEPAFVGQALALAARSCGLSVPGV